MASLADLFVRLSAETKDFKQPIDDAGKQLEALEGTAKSIGAALLTALPFAAIGLGAFKAAEDFEKAGFKIRQITGETGESLKGLEDSFKTLFANSAAPAAAITDALSQLSIRTGLTGAALESLTKTNLAFAKVTQSDVKTAVTDTQRLFSQWGISTDAQTAALNLLYNVTTKTGIGVSSLTSSLQTAGPALRTLGFDFKETAALIGSFEQHGLSADKAIAVLTKGMATFAAQGIKDPKNQLAGLIEQMQNAATTTEAVNIAVGAFGKKGAVYLADAARQGALDFKQLADAAAASADTVNKAASETKGWTSAWTQFEHQLTAALDIVGAPLLTALTDAVKGMKPVVATLGEMAKGFQDLPTPVKDFTEILLGMAVAGPLVVKAIGGITAALGSIGPAISLVGGAWGVLIAELLVGAKAIYDWKVANDSAVKSGEDQIKSIANLETHIKSLGVSIGEEEQEYKAGILSANAYSKVLIDLAKSHGDQVAAVNAANKATEEHKIVLEQTAAAAKKAAEEIKKAFSTLGLKDVALEAQEASKAFALLMNSGKLSADQVFTAVENLSKKLKSAFDEGKISEQAYSDQTEVLAGLLDDARDAGAGLNDIANQFHLSSGMTGFIAALDGLPDKFGMQKEIRAFNKLLNDADITAASLAGDLAAAGQAAVEAAAVMAKAGPLIPKEALDDMQKSLDYQLKIQTEYHETLLKQAHVRADTDVSTMLAANRQIQESDAFTQRAKQQSATNTLRAILEEEKASRGESEKQLQIEIDIKAVRGESATAQIIALETMRLKTQALSDASTNLGNVYVGLIRDFHAAFSELSRGIADNLIEWKDWGDTLEKIGTDSAKRMLETLLTGFFKPLEDKVAGLEATFSKGLTKALGGVLSKIGLGGGPSFTSGSGEVAKETTGAFHGVSQGANEGSGEAGGAASVPSAPGGGASGGSGLATGLNIAGLGVAVASGITQGIQMANLLSDTGKIEVNTRQCKELLLSGVIPPLLTCLPELKHLTDIWGASLDGFSKLGNIIQDMTMILNRILEDNKAGGLGGGFWGSSGGPGARTAEELTAAKQRDEELAAQQARNDNQNTGNVIATLTRGFATLDGSLSDVPKKIAAATPREPVYQPKPGEFVAGQVTPTFSGTEPGTGIQRMTPEDFEKWFSGMIRSGQKLPQALPFTAEQQSLVDKWQAVLDKDPVYQAEIARSTQEMVDLTKANAAHDRTDQNPLATAITAAFKAQSDARLSSGLQAISARMEDEMRAFLKGGPQVDFTKPEYSGGSAAPYLGAGAAAPKFSDAQIAAMTSQLQQELASMQSIRAGQEQDASSQLASLLSSGQIYSNYQAGIKADPGSKEFKEWQQWASLIPKTYDELVRMRGELQSEKALGQISSSELASGLNNLQSAYFAFQGGKSVSQKGVLSYGAAPLDYAAILQQSVKGWQSQPGQAPLPASGFQQVFTGNAQQPQQRSEPITVNVIGLRSFGFNLR